MPIYTKSKKIYKKYLTRKDNRRNLFRYYLKPLKKETNRYMRLYKGEVPNGGSYKKMFGEIWDYY